MLPYMISKTAMYFILQAIVGFLINYFLKPFYFFFPQHNYFQMNRELTLNSLLNRELQESTLVG